MDALELWGKHIENIRQSLLQDGTGAIRQDLFKLSQFVKARNSTSVDYEVSPVDLFWEVWRPTAAPLDGSKARNISGLDEDPPHLPPEIENSFLEELARLEKECRIPPYSPDTDDWRNGTTMEQFNEGSRYVHVGAASALRHWRRDGFSEYVTQTLKEVIRVLYLLGVDNIFYLDAASTRGDIVTLFGVRALALNTISRTIYHDGEYEDAFKMAADAIVSFQEISELVNVDRDFLLETFGKDHLEAEWRIRNQVARGFTLQCLNPQWVADAFEGLKIPGKCENWQPIANICSFLGYPINDDLWGTAILDEDGKEELWQLYWQRGWGWAAGQLTGKEYREHRRQDERDASLKRLGRYFFGEIWELIPEKAQERLVNADHLWFSEARGIALDAVLNDLQVAAETMCYSFIWEPLQKAKVNLELLEFVNKEDELSRKGFSPTLSDYSWVCRRPFFRAIVQASGLNQEEQQFLIRKLPPALLELRRKRDSSQHDPNMRLRREDVERIVKLFLGIGQPGVLRRLAEIGPKLAGK